MWLFVLFAVVVHRSGRYYRWGRLGWRVEGERCQGGPLRAAEASLTLRAALFSFFLQFRQWEAAAKTEFASLPHRPSLLQARHFPGGRPPPGHPAADPAAEGAELPLARFTAAEVGP